MRPKLHDSVGRNSEKLGGWPRVSLHENEEPLAPARERLRTSWDEILASEVIRRLGGLGDDPALSRQRKNLGYVRRLHETVFRLDAPEPVWEASYFDSFGDWNFGHLCGDNGKQDHVLVQHLVVFQVMQQNQRRILRF